MPALRALILVLLVCLFSVGGTCSWSASYNSRPCDHGSDPHCDHAVAEDPDATVALFVAPHVSRDLRSFELTILGVGLVDDSGVEFETLYDSPSGVRVDFVSRDPSLSRSGARAARGGGLRSSSPSPVGWVLALPGDLERCSGFVLRVAAPRLAFHDGTVFDADRARAFDGYDVRVALDGVASLGEVSLHRIEVELVDDPVRAALADGGVSVSDGWLRARAVASRPAASSGGAARGRGDVLLHGTIAAIDEQQDGHETFTVELGEDRGEVTLRVGEHSVVRDRFGSVAGSHALTVGEALQVCGALRSTGEVDSRSVRLIEVDAVRRLDLGPR